MASVEYGHGLDGAFRKQLESIDEGSCQVGKQDPSAQPVFPNWDLVTDQAEGRAYNHGAGKGPHDVVEKVSLTGNEYGDCQQGDVHAQGHAQYGCFPRSTHYDDSPCFEIKTFRNVVANASYDFLCFHHSIFQQRCR